LLQPQLLEPGHLGALAICVVLLAEAIVDRNELRVPFYEVIGHKDRFIVSYRLHNNLRIVLQDVLF